MTAPLTIEYWADYLCPWCYLAQDRTDYLMDRYGTELVWRPFELHPEIPPEGGPIPDLGRSRETTRWLRDELASAGLTMIARDRWSNSRRALALAQWASTLPEWSGLHRSVYRAYWAEGRDIADPAVLVDIALDAGISQPAATVAVAEGAGIEAVAASRERALALGIGNTPGWHLGNGVVFTGVHERAVFDRVIGRLLDRG